MRIGIKRRVPGLLLIACGAFVISPAASALDNLGPPEPVLNAPPEVVADVAPENPLPPESDGPELSATQTAGVTELLATDKRTQEFLAGKSYTIESIGPWTTGGETDQLVGALVIVRLTPAASFPMSTWPIIEYADDSDTSYTEGTVELAADNVSELVIDVDQTNGRVVGIQPDGADVQITPGRDTPTVESAEQ